LDDGQSLSRSARLISSIENVDVAYLNTSFALDAAVGMLIARRERCSMWRYKTARKKLADSGGNVLGIC
jgi:hypothetical protein